MTVLSILAQGYQKAVAKMAYQGVKERRPTWVRVVSAALGILFQEPHQMLKIGLLSLAGLKKNFTWYGLNPQQLTEEQSKYPPLLLLHGECHTQGVWTSLAKAIQKSGLKNPVYTVNLRWGEIREDDFNRVDDRIDEIKQQYAKWGKKDVQVDLVGYSRGAPIAYMMGFKRLFRPLGAEAGRPSPFPPRGDFKRKDIGKIILLGDVLSPRDMGQMSYEQKRDYESHVREIVGSLDFLTLNRSVLEADQQSTAACGHLGLPFSSLTHRKIIEWIIPNTLEKDLQCVCV